MESISLRQYCDELEGLLSAGLFSKAILLSRYILRHYPKHIRTYCLLGKAYLKMGRLDEAEDIFRRVLSADPEDIDSRLALAEIHKREESFPEALWQLERAVELEPGSSELRTELRELYGQHSGQQLARIRLSRGALGRIYARNRLYPRAIAEFKRLLEEDPERVDIELALAEALWRGGQLSQAEEVCHQLLEKLPYSLKANLLLGRILLEHGREEEARAPLGRAQALDPNSLTAWKLFGGDSPLPLEDVEIPKLGEAPEESPPLAEEEEEMEREVSPEVGPPPKERELDRWLRRLSELAPLLAEDVTEGEMGREEAVGELAAKGKDHPTLVATRALWESGELEAALARYELALLESPELVAQIVSELEAVTQQFPSHLAAHELLGDAYMRAERLEEALAEYHWVLRQL